jgi:hypothetical protein
LQLNEKLRKVWTDFIHSINVRCYDLILIALFTILFLQIVFNPFRINHDCADILRISRMLLEGQLPYVSFRSTNPPLIFYLSILPALIEKFFNANIIVTFSLLILCIIIWSSWTIKSLLQTFYSESKLKRPEIIAILYVLGSYYVWSRHDFGQREHLFVLMYFPFFVMRCLRWGGGEFF